MKTTENDSVPNHILETCHACSSKNIFCEDTLNGRNILSDKTGEIILTSHQDIYECAEKYCGKCRAVLCQATSQQRVECEMRKRLIN